MQMNHSIYERTPTEYICRRVDSKKNKIKKKKKKSKKKKKKKR